MITKTSVLNLASMGAVRGKVSDEEILQFAGSVIGADRESALNELQKITAQLRHLYQNMKEGCKDSAQAKRLADGLLSPQIKRLEVLLREES